MTYYVITRNGSLVAVTLEQPYSWRLTDPVSISFHEFDGEIPDLNNMIWDSETDTFVPGDRVYTKLEFLTRMTTQERIAIRGSTDPVVEDIMELFDAAEFISAADTNTVNGLNYLALVGLLTAQRLEEILG